MRQEHRGHLGIPNLDKIGRPIPLANDALNSARERQRGRGKEQESEREREREREKERERERERESSPYLSCPDTCKASTEMVPTRCAYTTYLGIYVLQVGLVCVGSWSDDQGWNLPQLRSICQHGRPEYH